MQPNIVLLAGGCGSRLWPLSSYEHPKQFLTLPYINISSFQLSLKRSLSITSPKNITIITNLEYQNLLYQQIYDLGLAHNDFQIILEQYSNNTGIASYYCSIMLLQRNSLNLTYFFPTDHLISEEADYFKNILTDIDDQKINLFGQRAPQACTNFGYIVAGQNFSSNYYEVKEFIEKPDQNIVENLKNCKIYRNLGIYLATPHVLHAEFRRFHDDLPSITFDKNQNKHHVQAIYDKLPIDKMIAERSKLLNLTEINFQWRDIGSIESLYLYCSGSGLNCEVNSNHISQFNEQNKEFELIYDRGQVQITKKP